MKLSHQGYPPPQAKIDFVNAVFPNETAYCMGRMNSDCWYFVYFGFPRELGNQSARSNPGSSDEWAWPSSQFKEENHMVILTSVNYLQIILSIYKDESNRKWWIEENFLTLKKVCKQKHLEETSFLLGSY